MSALNDSSSILPKESKNPEENYKKPFLSVILIAKNEAINILECLQSVDFADEWIVVLDPQTTDKTKEIAEQFGAKVFQTNNWPGFGTQKNRALDKATGEWILSLDADERVTKSLQEEILHIINKPETFAKFDLYCMPRLTSFCGQWIRHCGWHPDLVTRLFRQGSARFSDDMVHEKIVPSKALEGHRNIGVLKNHLLHYSFPDMQSWWPKIDHYSRAWAQQKYNGGYRPGIFRGIVAALYTLLKVYIIRKGFLDGRAGLILSILLSGATFRKYLELYEMHRINNKSQIKNHKP